MRAMRGSRQLASAPVPRAWKNLVHVTALATAGGREIALQRATSDLTVAQQIVDTSGAQLATMRKRLGR